MNEDTQQMLIIGTTIAVILVSLFFFIWDYNKTELINFDETDFGYRDCLNECDMVAGNNGKTHLDEVQCAKDCNTFFYNKEAKCVISYSEDGQ